MPATTHRSSNRNTHIRTWLMLVAAMGMLLSAVPPAAAATGSFALTSPVVAEAGALPATYTCNGAGTSPPITWANPPKGTKGYAVVMDHVPPEGGHHWYWVMWGIPAKVRKLPAGVTRIGYLGGNSVNRDIGYAPPCSQGPGLKAYTLTIYALASNPKLPAASSASVTRDSLLSAISPITLSKAVLNVTYSR